MNIRLPSLCSIENDHPFAPTMPPGRAPRATAVKDAAANAAASAEPAQSVLDRASTVLPLSWRHRPIRVSRGVIARFFRLIIGGRSVSSGSQSVSLGLPRLQAQRTAFAANVSLDETRERDMLASNRLAFAFFL